MKKSSPVLTDNTSVTSSVNMTLNTNDLVDVLIQTTIESLNAQMSQISKQLNSLTEEYDSKVREHLHTIFEEHPDIVKFRKFFGISLILKVNINFKSESNEKLGSYKDYHYDLHGIPSKNGVTYYEKHLRTVDCVVKKYENVVKVNLYSEDNKINLNVEKGLSKTSVSLLNSFEKDFKKKYLSLKNQYHTLQKQLVEVLYNEKGVKARLIKKSLSSNDSGKKVLSILSSISGINMLEEDNV